MNADALAARLVAELGIAAGPVRKAPVHGGDINRAYRLGIGEWRCFVKVNRAERLAMFEAERAGLDTIRASGAIRAPRALAAGVEGGEAFLALEWLDLGGRPDPVRLGRALAAMHGYRARQFGFDGDNTIGSTPQRNAWRDDWREQRLGFQLALARQNGYGELLDRGGERLGARLDTFFADYRPRPSLLHGDLWSGNQGADGDGNPVIFDPACYYGDHEADLAMMELFGHPGERFFAAYREVLPIDPGYPRRRDLYNLYHVLNHANLFGGGYAAQAQRGAERLLAALR